MKPEDFQLLSVLVREKSGLVLTEDKAYLLESRLMPLTRKRGLKDMDELIAGVRNKRDGSLVNDIVEAMTTNESLFFRDTKPFEQLEKLVLPKLMEARASTKKIRIWSAASSSGQEPYSIAMMLKEAGSKLAGWRIEIVATDLSEEMLSKARSGIYTQFEVQRGLPITYLVKYFQQDGDKWRLDGGVRSMVEFKPFNLLHPMTGLGEFDVVFCRNVLIYFDHETKGQVLGRISNILQPDGVLYLGGAETVLGVSDRFQPVSGQRGLYQLADSEPALMSA